MKKLLIAAILFALNSNAQQITWQKYFHSSNSSNIISCIIQFEDSGFLAGTYINQPNPGCRVIRLDKNGDTVWVRKESWGALFTKSKDYGYLASVSGIPGKFIRLNENFDSLFTIDLTAYNAFFPTAANDSGFILNSSNTIIKTDSLGVVQWTGNFSGSISKVIPCTNGDILVVGMYAGYGDTYKAKLFTATGQVLWERRHGMVEEDWGVIQEFGMKDAVELPDGNFLVAAGGYHPHINDSSGWDMIKLNRLTGDTLQTYVYDTISGAVEYLVYMTYTKDSNIVAYMDGILLKVKQDGILIWYRNPPINEVWDIIGCNDNGIAIAGSLYYLGNPITKSAYAKLDSLGNIYNFQSIPELAANDLRLYPNPAVNQLKASPPTPLQGRGEITVTIYDMLGKIQLQQTQMVQNDFKVDINNLPSGIYMLQLKQEDRLFNGRFVKE